MGTNAEFAKLIQVGRPPNIVKRFPHSQALIVSGKVIDQALVAKGKAMTIAANGRNGFVIRGALMAAQRAIICSTITASIATRHSAARPAPAV